MQIHFTTRCALLSLCLLMGLHSRMHAQPGTPSLPSFSLNTPDAVREWNATHDVRPLKATSDGMEIQIVGSDPYITGPLRDYPTGQPLWLRIRLKSAQSGMGQIFYFTRQKGTNEEDSIRFPVSGTSKWQEIRVPLPSLSPGTALRLDPPGTSGSVIVASIRVEPRNLLMEPAWPAPEPIDVMDGASRLTSGDIALLQSFDQWGGQVVRVAGEIMAIGQTSSLIGYEINHEARWFDLSRSGKQTVQSDQGVITVTRTVPDEDGAVWTFTRQLTAGKIPSTVEVTTTISVNRPRNVLYLPLLMLHPGAGPGSFGKGKDHALFAGLEYLDKNEPSSSEADIIGPGANRQVPDTEKITIPLMAIQANDRYIGLIWEPKENQCALFDSPDRLYRTDGHVMGLLFPGSDGSNRVEGNRLPYEATTIMPNRPVISRATIIGGRATNVIPAVQQYVALRGLPRVPKPVLGWEDYLRTVTAGWLDSKIYEDGQLKHAYPGSFTPQPAADAAFSLDWMALHTTRTALARKQSEAARNIRSRVPTEDLNTSGVGHVHYPVESLFYGGTAANAEKAEQQGRKLLGRFEPDGTIPFRKSPDGLDYGKTHFEPDANGLTGQVVATLLETAIISGDDTLIREGITRLRALDKFAGSAPRGAQTWEVPLHTPDILASAHLVRAYTLGYELTGETHFLEQARYWAWTGVPFVYLVPPTSKPVGLYGTIPVLGATQWIAPNWMGLPVQWCGLVYADALYRFVRHDPDGIWKQIADGITASGIQQTWPISSDKERPGLLPDSFAIRPQIRNDAAINPGTLFTEAVRLYGKPFFYDFRSFRVYGALVHTPGEIGSIKETPSSVSFIVQGWAKGEYEILISGLKTPPRLRIEGKETPLSSPNQWLPEAGRLILKVQGKPKIELLKEKA